FNPGEWVNFTRAYPAGKYNVYARVSNGNGGAANAYLAKVTSGRGTADQTATRLGTFSFQARGWSSYDYVPLRDRFGNLVTVDFDGSVTALRFSSGPQGGGVNLNFLFLVPARVDLPLITEVYPDGATLLQRTNQFTFRASNPTIPINTAGVQLTLNGFDVSSQLTLTGSSTNWLATLPLALNYTNYAAVMKVTDTSSNVATTTVYFDTFSPANFTWEGEDFDFDGGSFIDNSPINGYAGQISLPGTDEDYVTYDGSTVAHYYYRPYDYIATDTCGDTPLPLFAAITATNSAFTNYNIGWWHSGSWINYTRTYPNNNFMIYGRLAGGNGTTYNLQLDQIVGGVTNSLGVFSGRGRGWASFDWIPLHKNGQIATVHLGGVSTLRSTTDGNVNPNLFMLVPATPAPATFSVNAWIEGKVCAMSFPTEAGRMYRVYYKEELSDAWKLLTIVSGDGTTRTVRDNVAWQKCFYRVSAE
ncbi:MAG TPA: hypothetical protein VLT36_13045, partial [Candidatus Dormibacteraeota bacterium]|nr:hypothetical protein [Candidatus Dormibacteraeota bacterium]